MIDFPKALRLVATGCSISSLVDLRRLAASRINEAIRLVETGKVKRIVLRPEAA